MNNILFVTSRRLKLVLALLFVIAVTLFILPGKATADYTDLPSTLPDITHSYQPYIHLSTNTNDPDTGNKAYTNTVNIKIYTTTPAFSKTLNLQFGESGLGGGKCDDFEAVSYKITDSTNVIYNGIAYLNDGSTPLHTIDNTGTNTCSITVDASQFKLSDIPGRFNTAGQPDIYVAMVRIKLLASNAAYSFRANISDTRGRIGFMGTFPLGDGDPRSQADLSSISSFHLQTTATSIRGSGGDTGNYIYEQQFRAPCTFVNPGEKRTSYVFWKDADSGQAANDGQPVKIRITDKTTGQVWIKDGGTGDTIQPMSFTVEYDHVYSLEFGADPSNGDYLAKKNGLRIWIPFDTAGSALSCPQPPPQPQHTISCQQFTWDLDGHSVYRFTAYTPTDEQSYLNPAYASTSSGNHTGGGTKWGSFTAPPIYQSPNSGDGVFNIATDQINSTSGSYSPDSNSNYRSTNPGAAVGSIAGTYTLNYPTPNGPDREVFIEHWSHEPDGTWSYTHGTSYYGPPGQEDCSGSRPGDVSCNLSISGNLGDNNNQSNTPYNATLTATNRALEPIDGIAWSGDAGASGLQQFTVNYNTSSSINISPTPTAPSNIGTYTLTVTLYSDGFAVSNCSATLDVYEPFRISVHANTTMSPDSENPDTVDYHSWITHESGPAANVLITSSQAYRKGGTTFKTISNQTYASNPPNQSNVDVLVASYPPDVVGPGVAYCTDIDSAYSSGYVGPGGALITNNDPGHDSSCPLITDKPFFKSYGGSLSAGGDFVYGSDTTCNGGGELAGWYNNVYNGNAKYYFGSSTELSALAFLKITGVASAQAPGSYTRSPTDLTFANNVPADKSTATYSPGLGGSYSPNGSHCLTDVPQKSSPTTVSGAFNIDANTNGAYKATGNVTLSSSSTMDPNHNVSLYVENGDVYIANNIAYTNTGWVPGSAPSLVLHVKNGNIYIAPSVKNLDGLYTAEPGSSTDTAHGKIYTCGTPSFQAVAQTSLFGTCNYQLTVHGSFVARHVNLMRTYGSLRDEKPTVQSAPKPSSSPLGLFWTHTQPNLSVNDCVSIWESQYPDGWTDGWTSAYPHYLCAPKTSGISWSFVVACWQDSRGCNSAAAANYSSVELGVSQPGCGDTARCWTDNSLYNNKGLKFVFSGSDPSGMFCTPTPQFFSGDPYQSKWANARICEPYDTASQLQPPDFSNLSCSNAAVGGRSFMRKTTCAAEVFDFSPELYLSRPALNGSNSNTGLWNSITSLPPVL